ncbi:hypothetical protein BJX61DRAFT_135595 [Aspergillus egyptiacus]|nr:hypothetical protein BJX61DRAFT_135595 [Aspergillus egyptiacus]
MLEGSWLERIINLTIDSRSRSRLRRSHGVFNRRRLKCQSYDPFGAGEHHRRSKGVWRRSWVKELSLMPSLVGFGFVQVWGS